MNTQLRTVKTYRLISMIKDLDLDRVDFIVALLAVVLFSLAYGYFLGKPYFG